MLEFSLATVGTGSIPVRVVFPGGTAAPQETAETEPLTVRAQRVMVELVHAPVGTESAATAVTAARVLLSTVRAREGPAELAVCSGARAAESGVAVATAVRARRPAYRVAMVAPAAQQARSRPRDEVATGATEVLADRAAPVPMPTVRGLGAPTERMAPMAVMAVPAVRAVTRQAQAVEAAMEVPADPEVMAVTATRESLLNRPAARVETAVTRVSAAEAVRVVQGKPLVVLEL